MHTISGDASSNRFEWDGRVFIRCAGYLAHPFSKETGFTLNSAGAIRLFPPSYQGLAACRKGMVVSITTAFPSVRQVQSALCPGVTGLHQLCFCVSVRRCCAGLVAQLSTSVPQPGRKHNTLITSDGTLTCARWRTCFPPGLRSRARCFL